MQSRWPARLVLFIAVSVSVAAAFAISKITKSREQARFDQSIEQSKQTIRHGLSRYLTLMDSVRAYTVAKINMNATQFHGFVDALALRENYPGIDGLGIAIKAPTARIDDLLKTGRELGMPQFEIWPKTDQAEICTVMILEPLHPRNKATIGFDLYTEPLRRATAMAAGETGDPTATPLLELKGRTGEAERGMAIFVPVYRRGGRPETVEQRRTTVAGFVYCAFQTRELLRGILGSETNAPIGLRVFDGDGQAEAALIYQSPAWTTALAPVQHRRVDRMVVAGRPWTFVFASQPNFAAPIDPAGIVLLGGLMVSGMLWGITRSQGRAREAAELHNREIQELNTQLEQRVVERTAELQTAVDELKSFSYTVSHDLRAPLRHIDGYVNLLAENPHIADDAEAQRQAKIISKAALQMGQLVDGLLNFARIGWVQISVTPNVDVNEIVRDVRQMLTPGEEQRAIEWTIADFPKVTADRTLLRQVFANLVSNAVKYSGQRARAAIEIGYEESAGETIFFVRDNGVGFDMKYADKLFNVFQRLHTPQEFEGTGIGLAHIRKIVTRHGGRAWGESVPDQGATFYFSLPKGPGAPRE